MEQLGVIFRIEEPTSWCVGMVVVPRGDGSVRICVNLTKLNKAVCRERHLLPFVEQSLASLENATIFSKIDANSGFWQIELNKASAVQSLPLSSHHLADFISITCHSESTPHLNIFNAECHKFSQI